MIRKQGQAGKWRLILDLSSPQNRSVNDGIPLDLCSIRYASVDSAVEKILRLGRNSLLAKIDIKHDYRNIPFTPVTADLVCYGKEHYYSIYRYSFVIRPQIRPKISSAIADAVEWITMHRGVSCPLHYLDDFLTMDRAEPRECSQNLDTSLIHTCQSLGLPLKWPKLEGPSTVLIFLGIVLDTERLELRVLEEKLREIKVLITKWQTRKAGKKCELLSLIGKLAHVAKVIVPRRIFLRRMINTAHQVKQLHHWVHLNVEFKSDLAWW